MIPATVFLLVFPLVAIGLALREKHLVSKQVSAIRYRINVNGTRGKSTVTRLLTAALLEAGMPTIGKATGSKSCILSFKIAGDQLLAQETEMLRQPEGPNIKEVKFAIQVAAQSQAQVLVAECMAVNPAYQKVFAIDYLKSNYSIITNVLEDHMDVLGPSLQDVAEAFMAAVPRNSTLIVPPGEFLSYYLEVAAQKKVVVRVANPAQIPQAYCEKFSFPVFPENVALAMETAVALGVKKNVAMAGMLKAIPDVGAIRFHKIKGIAGEGVLINAFSANDPTTTMAIWHYLKARKQVSQHTTIIMNCRNDRIDRGRLFLKSVLNNMPTKALILIGDGTGLIYAKHKSLAFEEVINLGGISARNFAHFLQARCSAKDVFLGIGNYYGVEEICRELGGE